MKWLIILFLALLFLPTVLAVCTDYDGASGLTYPGSYIIESYVYGTSDAKAIISTASYDSCSSRMVKEWYCSATKYTTFVKYTCPYGCSPDGSGKCSSTYFCNDPDSSTLTTQTTATDSYGSLTDSCPSFQSSTVNEISCGTSMSLKQTTVACPALTPTCVNGACVKLAPSCVDSDKPPADYLHIQGTATNEFNQVYTDQCYGAAEINEFYCGGAKFDTVTNTHFTCPASEECKGTNGRCTPKPTCTDTDGGQLPNTAGKTTDNSGVNYANVIVADKCTATTPGSIITEYSCDVTTKQTKSSGYACTYGCSSVGNANGDACLAAASPTCTDSDGGQVYTAKGATTDNSGTVSDVCSGSTLTEYYCSPALSRLSTTTTCANGCSNGACSAAPVPTCSETDGGNLPNTAGKTTDNSGVNYATVVKSDTCSGTAAGSTITEWSCDTNNQMKYSVSTCANGCSGVGNANGDACLAAASPACTDSDNGQIYSVQGTATDNSGSIPDSCAGNVLTEYWCIGTSRSSGSYNCGTTGSTCVNGECTCIDSDGGADYNVKGNIFDAVGSAVDSCIGAQVREYTCDLATNRFVGANVDCQAGKTCNNGACSAVAPAPTCSETDGGEFPNTAGKTTDNSGVNYATVIKSDTCSGIAAGSTITEWSCDTNNQMKSSTSSCANGCSGVGNANGDACLAAASPTCTDSDSGQNFVVYGTTTDNTGSVSDGCVLQECLVGDPFCPNSLTEYYCSPTLSRLSVTTTCDYGCSGGTCRAAPASTCTDSDEGPNAYFVEGTTTDAAGSTIDQCKSYPPSDLIESICVNGAKTTETYTCPNGCSGRVCNPVTPEEIPLAFCSETDTGSDFFVAGTTTDNTGSYPDACSGSALTEYTCNPDTNLLETITTTNCGCNSGACAPNQCVIEDNVWQDEYGNTIEKAVINYPVSATVIAQGCTAADFAIIRTDTNDPNPVTTQNDITYTPDGNTGNARIEWLPLDAGSYRFNVNSLSDGGGITPSFSEDIIVSGPCPDATQPVEDCPGEWTSLGLNPNLDADCDGIRDCWDYWLGNAGCALDPNTGVPVCAPSCEGTAWNCDNVQFSECIPDPDDQESFIQTRDVVQCTKTGGDGEYCPPPSDKKGCVMETDFPIFSLMNILGVSILLIAFYSKKLIKI